MELFCKRDDLYRDTPGSPLQGNKIRKLRPLLDRPPVHALSFGGAYSNHLAALSEAGRRYGFPVTLYVRGEPVDNPVLSLVRKNGADLRFLDRSTYRNKARPEVLRELVAATARRHNLTASDITVIPEGGTTEAALKYTGEIFTETLAQLGKAPDYFCLSMGTGGTAAGIIRAARPENTQVLLFPALKGNWMAGEIEKLAPGCTNYTIIPEYHFGGYAKFPAYWDIYQKDTVSRVDLPEFPGIPLEPVYTAKLFSGVYAEIRKGYFPPGASVVVLHTGGIY